MSNKKVNDNTDLNDIRTMTHFKGYSFSNFKKTEVRNQFIENLKKGKIEPACYWCAELVCSGHFMDIWEAIIHYSSKYIHLGNPKLMVYLDKRFTIFRNIMNQGQFLNELQLRNYENIRQLFAEIVCVLSISNKKPSFETIKINRVEEFDITQMTERLKAPSIKYAEPCFQPKDPKELFIATNEFAYNISADKRNMSSACYWIEWTIEFDILCRKRKEPCLCQKRNEYNVDISLQRDIIWIVWDILLYYCENMNNPFITTIMQSIVNLFCIKYSTGTSKKRKYLLYFAVALLTEYVPMNIEMISDKTLVKTVVEKINNVYKQIKTNEVSPNTEYLFSNLDNENTFEESMKRMELMNKMMDGGFQL
jgi:hypothetical protein